jgi:outer membrane protein
MKRVPLVGISLVVGSALTVAAQTAATPRPAAPATPKPTAPAAPGAAVAAGPAKVAVIAFQAAVAQTNEFQRDLADLQKKYQPKQQQLKTLADEIDSLTKQVQAQGSTMSDAERQAKARTIDDDKKKLDRDTQDAQGDFQNDMQEVINRIAGKVGETMTDYAAKHGYTLVLDASQQEQQAPMVLYAVPSSDITKAVIDAYNEKSGVPAPPARPAASAAPDAPAPQPAK